MTAQEIFDKTWRHATAQGCPAFDGEMCRYRMDDGRMCFVGIHIPDDRYTERMESHGVPVVLDYMPELKPHVALLNQMQTIHDIRHLGFDLDEMKNRFELLAEDFGLSPEVLG